jgi:hypothetical protein
MNPRKRPTSRHIPPIDWRNLTDEALEELRTLVEAERQRRWLVQRPSSPVDELHDSPCMPHPSHVEAFDTYHCRRRGTRYLSRGELRQEARDETCVYVCTLCGQVADPTPLFSSATATAERLRHDPIALTVKRDPELSCQLKRRDMRIKPRQINQQIIVEAIKASLAQAKESPRWRSNTSCYKRMRRLGRLPA